MNPKRTKRVLTIIIIMLLSIACISGCSKSWEKDVSISDLYFEEGAAGVNYVKGDVKNNTDKYLSLSITASAENGSINETIYDTVKVKPNAWGEVSFLTQTDEKYTYKITDVTIRELEIPTLDENDLDLDTLEYYYPDVYENYLLLVTSLRLDFDLGADDWPYMTTIKKEEGFAINYIPLTGLLWVSEWTEGGKIYSFGIGWPETMNKQVDDLFFPYSAVFGFSIDSYKVKDLIREHDGLYYSLDGWSIMSEIEDGNLCVFMDR